MKGAMWQVLPAARLVDVSHAVAPQDVMEAAWVLGQTLPYYPAGTIHLVVVDPGVGTARRALAARLGEHVIVAPDNGLLPLVADIAGLEPAEVVALDRPEYWRVPAPSDTFHGRDVFGPVAAHLASGRTLAEVGTPVEDLTPLYWALPIADESGVRGWVVHVDRFGNCITNVRGEVLERHRAERPVRCYAGGAILDGLARTYADVADGEPLALIGSAGFLEISVNGGNAAALLALDKGHSVQIVFPDPR
jgi:S-adenosylmethionine hydrolase